MNFTFYLKKSYNRLRFTLCAQENSFYLFFYKYLYTPPKNTLSEFLDQYSKSKDHVVFLQIGANDGFIYDPLQKFIKRDDWEGVMVEPQPYVHDNLLTKIHAKRPEIQTVNAALAENDGWAELYTLAVSKERWANGLSSFNKKVLMDRIKDGTIQKKAKKEGLKLPDPTDYDAWIEPIKIKTISPSSLLAKFKGKKINLLAIDTEGYDFEIIKLLEIKNLLPEVIIYEEVNFDTNTKKECRSYLEKLGYSIRVRGKDVISVLK